MWCGRENSSAVHGGNRCESTGVCRRGFVSRILTQSALHSTSSTPSLSFERRTGNQLRRAPSEKRKERTQTRQTRDGTETGSPPARAGFWKDDQGDRWALLLLTRDTTCSQRDARWNPNSTGGLSSQSSDLPPACRWQSLATTGTLTQGWQGRRHESPTYYAGLTRGAACACPRP